MDVYPSLIFPSYSSASPQDSKVRHQDQEAIIMWKVGAQGSEGMGGKGRYYAMWCSYFATRRLQFSIAPIMHP